ncbi:MAG: succinate dehydrogenase cytochrome b subunit [bacterium]|nr:succinate dehydrogenase cytochrome b subunit [bacterium]
MRGTTSLIGSSVGKKIVMGLSGVLLFGFVIGHMIGNLKVYQGAEKFNAYAEFLREAGAPMLGHGQALWIARLVLLACVGIHIAAAVQLAVASSRARKTRYKKFDDLSFSYASRTMRWGGAIITAFVIYHILHLTLGTVHPDFEHGSAYQNLVAGFRVWPVSVVYILCMFPLGLHLYHGLWSLTQTLTLDHPRVKQYRRVAAAVLAGVVVVGNVSIPISVLTGIVG